MTVPAKKPVLNCRSGVYVGQALSGFTGVKERRRNASLE